MSRKSDGKCVDRVHDPDNNDRHRIFSLETPLAIYLDGPCGSPYNNIKNSEHAVLICTGIGVTPFASILQSILHRHKEAKHSCPKCFHQFTSDNLSPASKLRKLDFIWLVKDSKQFQLFSNVMAEIERE